MNSYRSDAKNSQNKGGQPQAPHIPGPACKPEWITQGIDSEAVNAINELAKSCKDAITTSQIRRFYGALKRIDMTERNQNVEVLLLRPKLAYAIARIKNNLKKENKHLKENVEDFYIFFNKGLDSIDPTNTVHLKNFVLIFEAFVAYHKYHGGKDHQL